MKRNPRPDILLIEKLGPGLPITPNQYGNKATNLQALLGLGVDVPRAVAIPIELATRFESQHAVEALSVLGITSGSIIARSSGITEDSSGESLAGHFESLICEPVPYDVLQAVQQVSQSGFHSEQCAVVLQEWIDATISGVAFSCDPITFARRVVINWIEGASAPMLSGEVQGHVLTSEDDEFLADFQRNIWNHLLEVTSKLAHHLKAPLDLEWCIRDSGSLTFVQARPIVLPPTGSYPLMRIDDLARIPSLCRTHRKVDLRVRAIQHGIPMAKCAIHLTSDVNQLSAIPKTLDGRSVATTIVLLHPETISDRVIRVFSGSHSAGLDQLITDDPRLSIHRYPDHHDVQVAIHDLMNRGLIGHTVSVVIEGQVLDADWTGIAAKTESGIVYEIARGHFVPKGLVETSLFEFNDDGELLDRQEVRQTSALIFANGHVILESPLQEPLLPDHAVLSKIAHILLHFLRAFENAAIEFGVIFDPDSSPTVFLIDVVEHSASRVPDVASSRLGVLSSGKIVGRVHFIAEQSDAHDAHFHTQITPTEIITEHVVYFAETDSLSLLDLVSKHQPGTIGFVFQRASILSHLAIVLRERQIPAAVLDYDLRRIGSVVELDVSPHAAKISTPISPIEQ